ncbi:Protein transport protein sec20 [Purpureocillium takamizusanense]|uniref:Protein transport protein sec20 n=1 Tax=Purpureocillium takamizusanense TaxID=2060973 RepID=A0A9Q8Q8W9_9HYPO|nr:Protein transport protein sec20 [Purpureocillium takamizusanense]UNI14846.1 Protein transport protein sec20 [Purpureocillium takamizusanense]
MSLERLQERLTALQETTSQLRDLIDRLAGLKFQPGSVPLGTDEEDSPSGELSAEIGQILRGGLEEQELLREEARFARPDGHDKTRLTEGVERLGGELASCRAAFRRARLAAKKSLEEAQRRERRLLIESFSVPVSEAASPTGTPSSDDAAAPGAHAQLRSALRHHQHHHHSQHLKSSLSEQDQQTVGASSNVTDALRRTHDLIAAELARSEFAHQTLEESSAALRQLGESYASLEGMLARSRDLLGALLRSQKSDTWYLQTSMYMLLATGTWLVFRRLLYGPMWWLVWLPLRVLFGVGSRAGSAVLQGKGGAGESGRAQQVGPDGREGLPPVEGLPDEDLPTAGVGRESERRADKEADPDSMVEQVGKIIDAAREADELGSLPDEEDQPRNPKKRMWEETETPVPAPGGEPHVRDEL